MKKSVLFIIFCLMMMLIGCEKASNTKIDLDSTTINSSNGTIVAEEEKKNDTSNSIIISSDNINYEDVFMVVNSEAALTCFYKNVDEYLASEKTETIVKGKINKIEYEYIEGLPFTKMTIEVQNVYKGEVNPIIEVYENGGYVRLIDEKEQIEPHADLSAYSDEEMKEKYIDYRFMGADHPAINDIVVLFLQSNHGNVLGDTYRVLGTVFGRYTLKEGQYVRPQLYLSEDEIKEINEIEYSILENDMQKKLDLLLND